MDKDIVPHAYRMFTCASCGYSFEAPLSCGNRFCVICSGPSRRRIRSKLNALIKSVSPGFGYKVRFLTLTIPHYERAKDGHQALISAFRRLRSTQWWRNRVAGGAYVIEVTGSPGKWHVHLHAMLECRFLPCRMLSKIWSRVSPGKIVHIKNIPLSAAISYCTAYLTKSEVDPAHQLLLSQELKGTRLFQPFGSWHSICLEIPKLNYCCPECGYTGFYWNVDDMPWERYGTPPPEGTLCRRIRDGTIAKHGKPDNAYYRTFLDDQSGPPSHHVHGSSR